MLKSAVLFVLMALGRNGYIRHFVPNFASVGQIASWTRVRTQSDSRKAHKMVGLEHSSCLVAGLSANSPQQIVFKHGAKDSANEFH